MKTVWTIPSPNGNEKEFGKHPTQKPLQLLERIILDSTIEGDLVFDPSPEALQPDCQQSN